jgi:hypothetical protein
LRVVLKLRRHHAGHARDCRFEQRQVRQVHALVQLVRNLQCLLQLGVRDLTVAGKQQRLCRTTEYLAGTGAQAEAEVLLQKGACRKGRRKGPEVIKAEVIKAF